LRNASTITIPKTTSFHLDVTLLSERASEGESVFHHGAINENRQSPGAPVAWDTSSPTSCGGAKWRGRHANQRTHEGQIAYVAVETLVYLER
jgi:hypothetical protein